jgi:hypothetical protein
VPAYTATVGKKRERERDIVGELHEDARWSMWTNTFVRRRGWGRGSLPRDPGVRTFMLAAILIVGIALAVAGFIAVVVALN